MSLPFKTVENWKCELCGLSLKDVVLPVRHDCKVLKKPCDFRGEVVREIECTACNGRRKIPVMACEIHGEAVLKRVADDRLYEKRIMSCERCIKKGLRPEKAKLEKDE